MSQGESLEQRWRVFFDDFRKNEITPRLPVIKVAAADEFFQKYRKKYEPFRTSGGEINVWKVAGLGSYEVRNCAVLVWLLDYYGSHGQDDVFLKCFLDSIRSFPGNEEALAVKIDPEDDLGDHYRTSPENPYFDEDEQQQNRVDIVVDGRKFLLFIEVKIMSKEGEKQTERYSRILKNRAGGRKSGLIFLTQDGKEAQVDNKKEIACLSWKHFADSLETCVRERRTVGDCTSERASWVMPVLQFCQHIRAF
jgi:hypothetical protein